MSTQFKTIALTGRAKKKLNQQTFHRLIDYLQNLNLDLVIDEAIAEELAITSIKTLAKPLLGSQSDLVIVVGGDGSLLQAARSVVDSRTPVIGINRGRFGFLADIDPEAIEQTLTPILAGEYKLEQRFMLELETANQQQHALNDIVLASGNTAHMMEFEVYVNDNFMYSESSDGLIIATPTGSTAYALSGGGPILHPGLDAIVLVPMFSHSLSSRPIVLNADAEITIKVGNKLSAKPQVSCDGHFTAKLNPNESFIIRRKQQHLNLLHPESYNYFETLGRKLHWGKRLTDN